MTVAGQVRVADRRTQERPPAEGAPHVEFRDVEMRLGDELVHGGLSFAVRRGEFACVIGPSGCGKTTALRLIGGLLEEYQGELLVDGRLPRETWPDTAYVFQSPRLAPWGTALDNVLLAMDLRTSGVSAQQKRERAMHSLELVGLAGEAGRPALRLSGGERHRVALARALAVEPQLLLMDEPFSDLDVPLRRRLRQELLAIWRRSGLTVIFVTHDLSEAVELAERIIVFSPRPARVVRELHVSIPHAAREEKRASMEALEAELASILSPSDEATQGG
ncbi:MAG: ABC transporter ATP-binding protein [Chloroflexi bacterium]|nr:ABC transporter ATP-binding protein [Chloroflexota bacterium]